MAPPTVPPLARGGRAPTLALTFLRQESEHRSCRSVSNLLQGVHLVNFASDFEPKFLELDTHGEATLRGQLLEGVSDRTILKGVRHVLCSPWEKTLARPSLEAILRVERSESWASTPDECRMFGESFAVLALDLRMGDLALSKLFVNLHMTSPAGFFLIPNFGSLFRLANAAIEKPKLMFLRDEGGG